jgi:MerR family transcriptional regulator, thiopeptide resistance regulator
MSRLYKVREFADLAGVTVRTLHHYDRIALLKPQRSDSGYRLYSRTDLERLVQITALKFLGIPLHEIKVLLGASPLSLSESLRLQLRALTEKRDLITRAIQAIEEAERLMRSDQATDASALRKIIEVIEMRPEPNFMRRYYTEEAWAKRMQLREQRSPETLEGYKQEWRKLFLEVETALDLDPAGETAQGLARRWVLLAEVATGGDAEIRVGAIKAWKDHQNWPPAEQEVRLAYYGLDAGSDRDASMRRLERVGKFIGQAIGRKYLEALQMNQRLGLVSKPPADRSSAEWAKLFRDVESSLVEDPASEKAQLLAARWKDLQRSTQIEARGSVLRLDDFRRAFRDNCPSDASVAVVNQVARLYRIEQVSNFLKRALACCEGESNSAYPNQECS